MVCLHELGKTSNRKHKETSERVVGERVNFTNKILWGDCSLSYAVVLSKYLPISEFNLMKLFLSSTVLSQACIYII